MELKIEAKDLLVSIDYDRDLVPPQVMPVLYLKGSFSEMGVQYGRQLACMIRRNAAVSLSDALLAVGSAEDVAKKLQIYVDITAAKAPELVEMWQGIALGAGLSFAQVALVNCKLTVMAAPTNCSGISAWGSATQDGKLITACNVDTVTGEGYYGAVLTLYPDKGNALITTVNLAGKLCGGATLNDKGLCMSITGGQAARAEDHKAGYDPIGSMIYVLLRCGTIDEAIDCYLNLGVFSAGTVMLSKDSQAVIIEHTCVTDVVRRCGDYGERDFIHTTNHFLSPELQPAHFTDPPILHSNIRYDTEELLLKERHGTLTPQSLLKILACNDFFKDGVWSENAWDADRSSTEELGLSTPNMRSIGYKTNSSVAAVPGEGTIYVISGSADTNCSLIPGAFNCTCRLTLRKSPLESVREAEQEAITRLWESAKDFSLGQATGDRSLLDTAKAKFWAGVNCRSAAMLEPDTRRALKLYGEAATRFAEAQALAYSSCGNRL